MRCVLVSPPGSEPVCTPLLGLAYLASALRCAGHEVWVVDGAAPFAPDTSETLAAFVAELSPDVVGVHLKTLEVRRAYDLVAPLASLGVPLIAGGPHATVRPLEPLRHGFDLVVTGEAEDSLPALLDHLEDPARVDGVSFVDRGIHRHRPRARASRDLDALPDPHAALDAFFPEHYGADDTLAPGGLLSSRGCPAACTFCSNAVTGRRFRYHSAARVAAEAKVLRDRFDTSAFCYLDDSFAVGRRRMNEVCDALEALGGIQWTCTAHPAHLHRDILFRMRAAGCTGIDIGLESVHADRLRDIGKGLTVERALAVLRDCAELGLHTVVNLMVGWPDETEAELADMLQFIEAVSPIAGAFNARGVLVPHPGTPEYELHHERAGFTDWWLHETLPYEPFPAAWDPVEVVRAYAADAALDRNFFGHDEAHLESMREVLCAKAHHTFAKVIARSTAADAPHWVAAAGAR